MTRKKARFLGKIPADFRFSPPGKIRFLPFPTWKKPEKKTLIIILSRPCLLNTLLLIVFAHPRFSDIDFCISYSSVSGVLPDVIEYYNITNAQAGLLQTSFIFVYMIFSPLFGYLGDRYNRKWLMAIGIFLWSVITLAGSFVPAKVS